MTLEPHPDFEPIPVSVITGFLGSGKTTLLNNLLSHPRMEETAVVINEFGEVGLDHLLVKQISEDIVLLNSGCLCCTVRGDLVDSLRELFVKRLRGEVPKFRRVAIETTGLADPAPIIHTLLADPTLGERYRVDGIITTVDAVHGSGQLDQHDESVKQVAVADRIVLTKSDLAKKQGIRRLMARLKDLNPGAVVIPADHGDVDPDRLLDAGLFDSKTKIPDVERWLNEEAYREAEAKRKRGRRHHGHDHDGDAEHEDHRHHHDVNRHDERIRAFCMTADAPLPWDGFVSFLEVLLATHGANVLRIKGILEIEGEEKPIAVHGVQHVFHPPTILPAWPKGERRSRIVFITRDLGQKVIEETFAAFMEAARKTPASPRPAG